MLLIFVIIEYIKDCKRIGKENLAVPLSKRLLSYCLCVPIPIILGIILGE